MDTKNECLELARLIADGIESITRGEVYYHEGNLETLPPENEDGVRLDEDGNEIEAATLYDWLNSQLGDVRFEVNQRREVTGGRVLCCFGGPNAWAHDDAVRVYWGTDSAEWTLTTEARAAMLDMLSELWGEV